MIFVKTLVSIQIKHDCYEKTINTCMLNSPPLIYKHIPRNNVSHIQVYSMKITFHKLYFEFYNVRTLSRTLQLASEGTILKLKQRILVFTIMSNMYKYQLIYNYTQMYQYTKELYIQL